MELDYLVFYFQLECMGTSAVQIVQLANDTQLEVFSDLQSLQFQIEEKTHGKRYITCFQA